jgi:hypothetical protein
MIHSMTHEFKRFFFEHVTPLVSWVRFGVNVWKRRKGELFWNPDVTQSRWNAGKSIDRTFGVKTNSLIAAIKMGACLAPGIAKLEDGVAVFMDGKTFEYDCVVNCTGFQTNLSFVESSADREALSRPDGLFWHMLSSRVEKMATVGFLRPSFGVILTVAELQARYLAQLWSGDKCLPCDVDRQVELQIKSRTIRYGERLANQIPSLEEFLPSLEGLAALVGCRPSVFAIFLRGDWKLWFHLLCGPLIAARYRLQGPDSNYAEARRVLLSFSWSEGYIGVLSLYAIVPSTISFLVETARDLFKVFF